MGFGAGREISRCRKHGEHANGHEDKGDEKQWPVKDIDISPKEGKWCEA
jgi:hypothetical protein